jgi:hypothetical protein
MKFRYVRTEWLTDHYCNSTSGTILIFKTKTVLLIIIDRQWRITDSRNNLLNQPEQNNLALVLHV